MGFKPGAAEWKAQTNPLSYGAPLMLAILYVVLSPRVAEP